jgi:hypothetical protein
MSTRRIVIDPKTIRKYEPKPTLPVAPATNRVIHKEHRIGGEKAIEIQGRIAWALLHVYTVCYPYVVTLFEGYIPSASGCSCKENYKAILADYPFDYSSPDAFFESGVRLHNAVNRKLGKPEITIEEARSIWRKE